MDEDRFFKVTFDPTTGATYCYIPGREPGTKVHYTREVKKKTNVYVDYDENDKPMGIEILSPGNITVLEMFRFLGC